MAHRISDQEPAQQVVLSDEQFSRLVELLTPGYEAAKLMLAQHAASAASEPAASDEDTAA